MTSFCVFCNKKHDDFAWKLVDLEDKKTGWVCRKAFKPSGLPEYVPDSLKQERTKYAKEIVQPFRQGEGSREFAEAYPQKAERMWGKDGVKKLKYVWGDIDAYKRMQK